MAKETQNAGQLTSSLKSIMTSNSSSRGAGSCSKWLKAEDRLGMFWDVEVVGVVDDDDDAVTAETAGTICRLLAMTTIYWAKSVQ
jgi:hypothetical protein